jgi:hypothetical protein
MKNGLHQIYNLYIENITLSSLIKKKYILIGKGKALSVFEAKHP